MYLRSLHILYRDVYRFFSPFAFNQYVLPVADVPYRPPSGNPLR